MKTHVQAYYLSTNPQPIQDGDSYWDNEAFMFTIKSVMFNELDADIYLKALRNLLKYHPLALLHWFYVVINYVVQKIQRKKGSTMLLSMVPQHLIRVLKVCHEDKGCNVGFTKSLTCIRQNIWWDQMRKTLCGYVQACLPCQKNKCNKLPPMRKL